MSREDYFLSFIKRDTQLSETQVRRFTNRYPGPGGSARLERELTRRELEIDTDDDNDDHDDDDELRQNGGGRRGDGVEEGEGGIEGGLGNGQ